MDNAMVGSTQIDVICVGDTEVWSAFRIPSYTGSYAVFGTKDKGRIELYTSGTLTISKGIYDVFAVGGGGSGARGSYYFWSDSDTSNATIASGAGSGYTKTWKKCSITGGKTFVTIGSGGAAIPAETGNHGGQNGYSGGSTSVSFPGVGNLSASGGSGGACGNNWSSEKYDPVYSGPGGSGGSGGSVGGYNGMYNHTLILGAGGSDGSAGKDATYRNTVTPGGAGQGTTTRAFGESSGTLYAGGGSGDAWSRVTAADGGAGGGGKGAVYKSGKEEQPTDGLPNTGGGGGGGHHSTRSGGGGSGLMIIRWGY